LGEFVGVTREEASNLGADDTATQECDAQGSLTDRCAHPIRVSTAGVAAREG